MAHQQMLHTRPDIQKFSLLCFGGFECCTEDRPGTLIKAFGGSGLNELIIREPPAFIHTRRIADLVSYVYVETLAVDTEVDLVLVVAATFQRTVTSLREDY